MAEKLKESSEMFFCTSCGIRKHIKCLSKVRSSTGQLRCASCQDRFEKSVKMKHLRRIGTKKASATLRENPDKYLMHVTKRMSKGDE